MIDYINWHKCKPEQNGFNRLDFTSIKKAFNRMLLPEEFILII